MGLAAMAAVGLPPFGLFFSELTIISGGIAAGKVTVSVLVLVALIACFCGILQQLTRILLGAPKRERISDARPTDGLAAMVLLLGALLVFSVWLPAPLLELMRQAAGIIGGEQLAARVVNKKNQHNPAKCRPDTTKKWQSPPPAARDTRFFYYPRSLRVSNYPKPTKREDSTLIGTQVSTRQLTN